MKKILYILSAMGLIVSSCSKDIDTDLSSGDNVAASFTNSTITRATNEVWAADDQIGIFAFNSGAIYNSYANIPYQTVSGGQTASFTPSGATTIYYPEGGDALKFLAYSPYQATASDGIYDIDLSPQSTTAEVALIDLIVAYDGTEYSSANSTANLTFDHKLAKLTMTLKAGYGLDAADLEGATVKLTNIATSGTYNFSSYSFTTGTANQTITPRTITANSQYEAIIFPYGIATFDVEFYLPETGKTYTWDINGEKFTSGQDHAYTVEISESKISVSNATLSGWGVNDSEDLVAEMVGWDGTTIATSFESGTGSDTNPFIIANGAQLAYLAQQVNDNITQYSNTYFKLSNNINLNGNEWTPIGKDETNSFNGTFDGNGKVITGLKVTISEETADVHRTGDFYIGLFGYIGAGGIKDLKTSINSTLYVHSGYSIIGYSGGIVGRCASGVTLSNIICTGSISLDFPAVSDVDCKAYVGNVVGWMDEGETATITINDNTSNDVIITTGDNPSLLIELRINGELQQRWI